ncbi:hypothetical protein RCCGE510_04537 [Rhizobium sp. CCGE 510]|nr:hypothetical protein RCCGE510_04537 [Rhizobium sp. CCGE 510]
MINGFHTGSPWVDLPERYGPYTICYNRFVRWRKADDADSRSIVGRQCIRYQHSSRLRKREHSRKAKPQGRLLLQPEFIAGITSWSASSTNSNSSGILRLAELSCRIKLLATRIWIKSL